MFLLCRFRDDFDILCGVAALFFLPQRKQGSIVIMKVPIWRMGTSIFSRRFMISRV